MSSLLSYKNAIIGSIAIVTSASRLFYDGFNIQNFSQLAAYAFMGTALGVAVVKSCNRKSKNSGIEGMVRFD